MSDTQSKQPLKSVFFKGHFYSGQWHQGDVETREKGEVLVSENPATGDALWQGVNASPALVSDAVNSAQLAFEVWSRTPREERQKVIERFAEVLKENQEILAQTIHEETGKPLWESKTEAQTMVGKIGLSINAYDQRTPTTTGQGAAGVSTQLTHRPHGVFAVLGPYNFPGHLPNGHIVPALLAGNTVVFKPSELTPKVGELMVTCWQKAGLPDGVLNLIQGGKASGEALVTHPKIDGVLFTGSSHTGSQLHRLMAGQPEKMLALEMGGNNPLIVDDVSDVDAVVYAIIQSAFISAGQRCTCARRLILTKSEENERVLARLVSVGSTLSVGESDSCFMGSLISNDAADRVLTAQEEWLSQGANALLKMQRSVEDRPFLTPGIVDVTAIENRLDEEHFGPLLQVIWVDDFEAAITEANQTRFGLASGLLSDSPEKWARFYDRARAGIVNWNRPLTGASGAAPFGGIGASGNHRPSAYYAADYSAYPMATLLSEKITLPEVLSPGIAFKSE
ncbi:succinylglutamate-semialdehyde dehydrogenase [Marinibactrum halimedae]|uniref:N-succinylglutamate 5-semialdehyde dehydrogenase n=1 Tax=Marinibactrum halimedae TaxID=1444977 RepID=A0AA37WPN2_9GAMM|nr:succinylglutamate-semialdehyde dehydrogenase [Marinibactrum halimedae]MCD9460182.1 succinylglutamate-semialdehyde dehydrogenase [Marinibactrum halimedae]GLS26347.1 N-succinylglutamate 5-semialdehyde dehydrogenase [Marinibactrum halimedae]